MDLILAQPLIGAAVFTASGGVIVAAIGGVVNALKNWGEHKRGSESQKLEEEQVSYRRALESLQVLTTSQEKRIASLDEQTTSQGEQIDKIQARLDQVLSENSSLRSCKQQLQVRIEVIVSWAATAYRRLLQHGIQVDEPPTEVKEKLG